LYLMGGFVQVLSKIAGIRLAVASLAMLGVLMVVGCGGTTTTSNNATATPTFSPGGGNYSTTQSVIISSPTPNSVFYCTTDGTTPTSSSPQCAQPTTVFQTEFLQAIAVAPGKTASTVGSAGYTISLNNAPPPSFSPAGGTYLSSQVPVTVTITDAVAGANIYYTLDGTAPALPSASNTSKLYTAPIAVSATETVNAIATASNFGNSGVASATYTIGPVAASPTFSITGGTYSTPQQVGLSDATSGATIYYTTDGTTPTTSSDVYKGVPIAVSTSLTINAMAAASGYTNSEVASASYVISFAPAPTPTFSLTNTLLSIDTVAGTTIYYTTDGKTTPTVTPTEVYGGPITVLQGEVVQAIAAGPDYLNSAVGDYVVNFPPAASPTFSLSLVTSQLSISDTTSGAVIYYTTDGSVPNTGSLVYSTPFTVTNAEVVKAIAGAPGLAPSPMVSDTVEFQTPSPTISPASGLSSTVPLTITLSDVPGTTIYYTTDGSAPPTSGSNDVYSGPFTVSSTTTVKAIATATSFSNSPVVSATYTIAPGNTTLGGSVMTGTLPIKGADVQLYAAGQATYGSSGLALLAQPVATDTHGDFSFTFNCPAAPGDLVYLVATGGDSGSGTNSSIKLMTALGSCNNTATWTPSVLVNEATTVASVYALSAFAKIDTTNGGIDVGAPALTGGTCDLHDGWLSFGKETCNYNGLASAFQAVNNLVNIGTGTALSITPGYANGTTPTYSTTGTAYSGPSFPVVPSLNTSTAPQARVNALANVLASCVESDGSGCASNLFAAATATTAAPPNNAQPADTLQAVLNIAQNPGSNGISPATLLGLMPSSSPYKPALAATPGPNDLTLALTFTGGGLGIAPGVGYGSTNVHIARKQVINTGLAIDASGNIWVGGYQWVGTTEALTSGEMLAGFNNQGVPLTTPTTVTTTAAKPVYGGFIPETNTTAGLINPVIDQAGNLWAHDGRGANLLQLGIGGPLQLLSSISGVGAANTAALTIDSHQNLWIGGGDVLYEYSSGGTQISQNNIVDTSANASYSSLLSLTFDSNGGLWAGGQVSVNGGNNVFDLPIVNMSAGSSFGSFLYDPFPSGGADSPYNTLHSAVADNAGNVYACVEPSGTTLDSMSYNTSTGTGTESSLGALSNNGRGCGYQMVLDGLGNIFAADNYGTTGVNAIDEYTTAGRTVSPSSGYTGMGAMVGGSPEPLTLNVDTGASGLWGTIAAIDASGNLWVINANTGPSATSAGNVLVEYVGIGAPVLTPASVALKNGQLGTRP
jgi:hypothetical protein